MDSLGALASCVFAIRPRTSKPENMRYPRRSAFWLFAGSVRSALRLLIDRVPRIEKRLGGESMLMVVRGQEGRADSDRINSRFSQDAPPTFMPERNALQMQKEIQRESGYKGRI